MHNITPPRPVSFERRRPVGTHATSARVELPELPAWPTVLKLALGVGALVVGGLFVGAPYKSAAQLGDAVAAGDAVEVEALVDFPALREDLKAQAMAAINPTGSTLEGPEGGLAVVGAAFVGGMVDALVRPEMVARLKDAPVDDMTRARLERAVQRARMGYDGPMTFSVRVMLADISDDPITLRFGRSGLLSWQLKAVTLPKDLSKLQALGEPDAPSVTSTSPGLVRLEWP